MSGYQPNYVPGDRSPAGGQPDSPWSAAQTLDLKTNVNRQKTKRWVDAKKYSYAGDDWGDSEDDDEDEPPQPDAPAQVSTEIPAPAIIRPADIYRRMAAEKDASAHAAGTPSWTETAREARTHAAGTSSETETAREARSQTPPAVGASGPTKLPELRPLSGFEAFLGSGQFEASSLDARARESVAPQIPTVKEEPALVEQDALVKKDRALVEEHALVKGDKEDNALKEEPTLVKGDKEDHALQSSVLPPVVPVEKTDRATDAPINEHPTSEHQPGDVPQASHQTVVDSVDSSLREPDSPSEESSEINAAALNVSPLCVSKRSSIVPSIAPGAQAEPSEQLQSQSDEMPDSGSSPAAAGAVQPPLAIPSSPPTVTIPALPYNIIPASSQPGSYDSSKPRLKKKFSWEVDSDEGDRGEQSPLSPASVTLTPGALVINKQLAGPADEALVLTTLSPEPLSPDTPQRPTPREAESTTIASAGESHHTQKASQSTGPAVPIDPTHKPAPNFRDIASIPQPTQRISAFNKAREVYARLDTGLDAWIKNISDSGHPENAETLQQNGVIPNDPNTPQRPVPSQAKFPKLSSLGNISLPSRSHDGSGPSHGHTRQTSGVQLSGIMNAQHVQAKGKDLLHSAGILSGKAGDAAKGLFAKSRNKFRNNGNDKGQISSPPPPPPPPPPAAAAAAAAAANPTPPASPPQPSHPPTVFSVSLPPPTPPPKQQDEDEEFETPRSSFSNQQQQHSSSPPPVVPDIIPRVKSLRFDSQPFSLSFLGPMDDIMSSNSDSEEKKPRDSTRLNIGPGLRLITEEQTGNLAKSPKLREQAPTPDVHPIFDIEQPGQCSTVPEIQLQTTSDSGSISSEMSGPYEEGSMAVSLLAGEKEIETYTVSEVGTKPTPESSVVSSTDALDDAKQLEARVIVDQGRQAPTNPVHHPPRLESLPSRRFSFELDPEEISQIAAKQSRSPAVKPPHPMPLTPSRNPTEFTFPLPPTSPPQLEPVIGATGQPQGYPTHPAHARTWAQPTPQRIVSPLPVVHRYTGSGVSLQSSTGAQSLASQQPNDRSNIQYSQAGAGCPEPGVYQPPEIRKRRRASLGLNEIIAKVNQVRNKGEQQVDPPPSSGMNPKRNGLNFKGLKFDIRNGKPIFGRRVSSDIELSSTGAASTSYGKQSQSVGGRDAMRSDSIENKRSAHLNLESANGSAHHLNTGIYDSPAPPVDRSRSPSGHPSPDTILSRDQSLPSDRSLAPDESLTSSRRASPAPSSNRNHWSPSPAPSEPVSDYTTTSRAGRFYKSINSLVPRLTQPLASPQISRQNSSSNEPPTSPNNAVSSINSSPSPAPIRSGGSSFVSNHPFNSTPPLTHSVDSPTDSERTAGPNNSPPTPSPRFKDLHFRSRSPLSRPPDSCDSPTSPHDPAQKLGTFQSSIRNTARVGDQETPWTITLPNDDQKPLPSLPPDSSSRRGSPHGTSTPFASSANSPPSGVHSFIEPRPIGGLANGGGSQAQTRLVHVASTEVVELPTNDDSSEEIVMSSTSYPGQEWQPTYLGQWD